MLEIFGMWMYSIENYIPTNIHTYLDHHLGAIACLLNFMACWLGEFTENTVGTIMF
jgi:hypothetical protein